MKQHLKRDIKLNTEKGTLLRRYTNAWKASHQNLSGMP